MKSVGIIVLLIAYLAYSPENSLSPSFFPAHYIQQLVGVGIFRSLMKLIFSVHVLESLYTLYLCRKHTGFNVGVGSYMQLIFWTETHSNISSFMWLQPCFVVTLSGWTWEGVSRLQGLTRSWRWNNFVIHVCLDKSAHGFTGNCHYCQDRHELWSLIRCHHGLYD